MWPFCRVCYHLMKEVLILPTIHTYNGPSGPLIAAPYCIQGALSGAAFLLVVSVAGLAARHMVRGISRAKNKFVFNCLVTRYDRPIFNSKQTV